MLLKKSAIAFLALFLLSGCTSTKKQSTTIAAVGHSTEYTKLSDFEKTVGDRVHFDYNKSELSSTAKGLLHKQACWLKRHSNIKATIEGHCDARGTREYNLALGEKRAEAVSQYLQSQGIDKSRLDTMSYGKEKPAVIGDTEAAWAQNRRAVSVVK